MVIALRRPTSTARVDVDTLPQMLMSRVDVVTGGASAVYGSDAVAGVVNFILDKNFTGFKYECQCRYFDIWRCWTLKGWHGLGHRTVRWPRSLSKWPPNSKIRT